MVTLSAHAPVPLPLKGAFDWHYLQCVYKKFGTAEYRAVQNIHFVADHFKTDSDDEYPDTDDEAPWLTYHHDRLHGVREKDKAVVEWPHWFQPVENRRSQAPVCSNGLAKTSNVIICSSTDECDGSHLQRLGPSATTQHSQIVQSLAILRTLTTHTHGANFRDGFGAIVHHRDRFQDGT